jgi:hypothetical protein
MFKKYLLLTLVVISLLALSACSSLASATPAAANEPAPFPTNLPAVQAPPSATPTVEALSVVAQVDERTGSTDIDADALQTAIAPMQMGVLTAEESAGLLYLREEEKLAHDVYLFLFDKWGINIFQNIAHSEQTHTDSVEALLDRYGLNDPAAGEAPGEFTDPALQGLYDTLVAQGSQSVADALKVGATIEEIDILDLEKQMALTSRSDILLVYQNLEKGSRNHLRSFTNTLQSQTGETYQPQYLTPEVYQAIVSTAIESGGNGQGGQGGNRA